jgi:hypothetical protein
VARTASTPPPSSLSLSLSLLSPLTLSVSLCICMPIHRLSVSLRVNALDILPLLLYLDSVDQNGVYLWRDWIRSSAAVSFSASVVPRRAWGPTGGREGWPPNSVMTRRRTSSSKRGRNATKSRSTGLTSPEDAPAPDDEAERSVPPSSSSPCSCCSASPPVHPGVLCSRGCANMRGKVLER